MVHKRGREPKGRSQRGGEERRSEGRGSQRQRSAKRRKSEGKGSESESERGGGERGLSSLWGGAGSASGDEASGASSVESLRGEGRSKSEARSGERIRATAPLEAKERSHSMEARGGKRVEHPEIVGVAVEAEEAKLSSFGVREPELRGKGGSFGEKDRHC